jgi:hypothetical protein
MTRMTRIISDKKNIKIRINPLILRDPRSIDAFIAANATCRVYAIDS